MIDLQIKPTDDLRTVAFKVCTALERAGTTAVLTGGSAATIYAPEAHQSCDADFIAYVVRSVADFRQAIFDLGFVESGRVFSHKNVPVTLDFPGEDIRIGSELVERYATIQENGLTLYVLTPTDSVRDRLASFFWFNDRSALVAACGVAIAQSTDVNLEEVGAWASREGESDRFDEFLERLSRHEL